MITFRQQGDFSRLTRFLERAKEAVKLGDLDKYGQAGVAALAAATPVDSGLTAKSWSYKVTNRGGVATPRSFVLTLTFSLCWALDCSLLRESFCLRDCFSFCLTVLAENSLNA